MSSKKNIPVKRQEFSKQNLRLCEISELKNFPDSQKILIKGKIDRVEHFKLRNPSRNVGVIYLRTQNCFLRCILFPENYKKTAPFIEKYATVYVYGRLIKYHWPANEMKRRNQIRYLSRIIRKHQVDVRGILLEG